MVSTGASGTAAQGRRSTHYPREGVMLVGPVAPWRSYVPAGKQFNHEHIGHWCHGRGTVVCVQPYNGSATPNSAGLPLVGYSIWTVNPRRIFRDIVQLCFLPAAVGQRSPTSGEAKREDLVTIELLETVHIPPPVLTIVRCVSHWLSHIALTCDFDPLRCCFLTSFVIPTYSVEYLTWFMNHHWATIEISTSTASSKAQCNVV